MSIPKPKRPPVYVLLNDLTRPRRRMILREAPTGLVHWADDTHTDQALAVAYCYAKTGARLSTFFRYNRDATFEKPTCLWCVLEPYKESRRPL